jgi:hypothetical protein
LFPQPEGAASVPLEVVEQELHPIELFFIQLTSGTIPHLCLFNLQNPADLQ